VALSLYAASAFKQAVSASLLLALFEHDPTPRPSFPCQEANAGLLISHKAIKSV